MPAALAAKHMYWPESMPVRLSKMRVQEPSGSSMRMWCGSTSTGFPSGKQGSSFHGIRSQRLMPGNKRLAAICPSTSLPPALLLPLTLPLPSSLHPPPLISERLFTRALRQISVSGQLQHSSSRGWWAGLNCRRHSVNTAACVSCTSPVTAPLRDLTW